MVVHAYNPELKQLRKARDLAQWHKLAKPNLYSEILSQKDKDYSKI